MGSAISENRAPVNCNDDSQGSLDRQSFPTIAEEIARRIAALRRSRQSRRARRTVWHQRRRRRRVSGDKDRARFTEIDGRLVGSFETFLPRRPYCADNLSEGTVIRVRTRALKYKHIQFNGPFEFRWMLYDVDRPGAAFAHRDAILPPPNILMINPANGHAHFAYLLAVPIARHAAARLKPLRYYAAVERGFVRRLGADRWYAGLLAKNPLHPHWRVEWLSNRAHTLNDLESWLFTRDMEPEVSPAETISAGRNCAVFEELRLYAYREVLHSKAAGETVETFQAHLLHVAGKLNEQFPVPLMLAEIRAISRSVARWTWQRMSVPGLSSLQSARGKRGAAKRWSEHEAARMTQPWKQLGISRATYYRQKKQSALST